MREPDMQKLDALVGRLDYSREIAILGKANVKWFKTPYSVMRFLVISCLEITFFI